MKTLIESVLAILAQIELYLSNSFNEVRPDTNIISHDNKRFPNLTLNLRSRQVYCGSRDAFLSPFRFALLRLLVESQNGIVTFDETCDPLYLNGRTLPWENGLNTANSSRRSAASRLSTDLWLAGIPYKVKCTEQDDVFVLVPINIETDMEIKVPLILTSSCRVDAEGPVFEIKKSLKSLKTQIKLMQKLTSHELDDPSVIIPPILSKLPVLTRSSKT